MTDIRITPGGAESSPPVAANGGSTEAAPAAPNSMLAGLRENAKRQMETKQEDFAVGGDFGDRLQIRYKPLPPESMDDFLVGKNEASMQRAIAMNMDMMARSCIAIIGYDQLTGVKEILKLDGRLVGLNHDLAVLLEIPFPEGTKLTARDVISFLFGNNGPAIGAHGDKVSEWMQDTSKSQSSR